jgi:hypothetical protein
MSRRPPAINCFIFLETFRSPHFGEGLQLPSMDNLLASRMDLQSNYHSSGEYRCLIEQILITHAMGEAISMSCTVVGAGGAHKAALFGPGRSPCYHVPHLSLSV